MKQGRYKSEQIKTFVALCTNESLRILHLDDMHPLLSVGLGQHHFYITFVLKNRLRTLIAKLDLGG